MENSDQIAGSLENLSLNSQAADEEVSKTGKKVLHVARGSLGSHGLYNTSSKMKNWSNENPNATSLTDKSIFVVDFYGDNGSYMYQQTYGYLPYGAYSNPSSPLHAMGYDGQMHALQEYHYPSPYYQPPPQSSQASVSQVEVSTFGDQASLSVETNQGNLNSIANGVGLSGNNGSGSMNSTFQDSRIGYDGFQTIPRLDMSMSSNGQSQHAANSGLSSYMNNVSSSRNQNLQNFPHAMNLHNAIPSPGVAHAYGYINHMYPNNMIYNHYGNPIRGSSGFGSYGYGAWKKGPGWYSVGNNNTQKGRGYRKENTDGLSELNKGPRVKGYKNPDGLEPATQAVKEQNLPLTQTNKDNSVSLIPDIEQYNKEDFPESYSDAKFFVIKSYSEDDVHKSIKYNVWASTSTGNKKLNAAFHDAKEKPDGCPIFLLFSVNTSGQFVGLAEMTGPVDFNKTLEYWQQDKWTGCFPVKWHIIKDVPNTSLRHITLENNENKPVTNSRDTQEVNREQGIQVLKIFKDHSSKTCILDDFEFYEAREKIIHDKKSKHQPSQKVSSGEPNDVVINTKEPLTNETSEKPVEAASIKEATAASTEKIVAADGNMEPVEN